MATRPYYRNHCTYCNTGRGDYPNGYVAHPKYAQSPESFISAFLLIQKDLRDLFDYIEPDYRNSACFSHRIHALLLRTCVEVEANCKAILSENGYSKSGNWNMKYDYSKIETSHFLSGYEVKIPNWTGQGTKRIPFSAWKDIENSSSFPSLPWYSAYNATKHERHLNFDQASFNNLIDACCGLFVLLSAQFGAYDFGLIATGSAFTSLSDVTEEGIGGYFRIKYPEWPLEKQYKTNWGQLHQETDPFQNFDYSAIKFPFQ